MLGDVFFDHGFFIDLDEVLSITEQQGGHDNAEGEELPVVWRVEALARTEDELNVVEDTEKQRSVGKK